MQSIGGSDDADSNSIDRTQGFRSVRRNVHIGGGGGGDEQLRVASVTETETVAHELRSCIPGGMTEAPMTSATTISSETTETKMMCDFHIPQLSLVAASIGFALVAAALPQLPGGAMAAAMVAMAAVCGLAAAFALGRAWAAVERPAGGGLPSLMATLDEMRPPPSKQAMFPFPAPRAAAALVPPQVLAALDRLVSLIVRDFVRAWFDPLCNKSFYKTNTKNIDTNDIDVHDDTTDFPSAAHVAVRDALASLVAAATRTRPAPLVAAVARVVLTHARECRASSSITSPKDDNNEDKHKITESDEKSRVILARIAARITSYALPQTTQGGSPVLAALVRDIFAGTILAPVVARISDPNTINAALLKALSKIIPVSDSNTVTNSSPESVPVNLPPSSLLITPRDASAHANTSPHRQIHIKIREATKLPVVNQNPIFCAVVLANEVRKTHRVQPGASPVWDTEFQIPLPHPPTSSHTAATPTSASRNAFMSSSDTNSLVSSSQLPTGVLIDIWSFRAILDDDIIGSVFIPFASLPPNRLVKQWYRLDMSDSKFFKTDSAKILIEIMFVDTGVMEEEEVSQIVAGSDVADVVKEPTAQTESLHETSSHTTKLSMNSVGVTDSNTPASATTAYTSAGSDPQPSPIDIHNNQTSATILSDSDGFTTYMQFLESRGTDAYLQLYIMVDTFRQLTSTDAFSSIDATGSTSTTSTDVDNTASMRINAIRSDAHQVLDTAFGTNSHTHQSHHHHHQLVTDTGTPLDFGDMNNTRVFVNTLRRDIDQGGGPNVLAPLQRRIESFLDQVYLCEFVESDLYREYMRNGSGNRDRQRYCDVEPVMNVPGRVDFNGVVDAPSESGVDTQSHRGRLVLSDMLETGTGNTDHSRGHSKVRGSHRHSSTSPTRTSTKSLVDTRSALPSVSQQSRRFSATTATHAETNAGDTTTAPHSTLSRLSKIRVAIDTLRTQITTIDTNMENADPSTYPDLLGSKLRLQTEIDTLMDMESDEREKHKHIDTTPFFDLSDIHITVIDVIWPTTSLPTSMTVSTHVPASTIPATHGDVSQRSSRGDALMGIASMINQTTNSIASSVASISGSTTSLINASATQQQSQQHQQQLKPSVQFRLRVERKDGTDAWDLVRTHQDFEQLLQALVSVLIRAEDYPLPDVSAYMDGLNTLPISTPTPPKPVAAKRQTSSTSMLSLPLPRLKEGVPHRSHSSANLRVSHTDDQCDDHASTRQALMTSMNIWLHAVVSDPIFSLVDATMLFLAKSVDRDCGDGDVTRRKSHRPSSMVFEAIKNAGSAFKMMASGNGLDGSGGAGGVLGVAHGASRDTGLVSTNMQGVAPALHKRPMHPSRSASATNTKMASGGSNVNANGIAADDMGVKSRSKSDTADSSLNDHNHMDQPQQTQTQPTHKLSPADLNLILECAFTSIEELFQLTSPAQWIRQQGLHMVRLVLHQTYGHVMSDWLQRKIEEVFAVDRIVAYLDKARAALWPNDARFGSTPSTSSSSDPTTTTGDGAGNSSTASPDTDDTTQADDIRLRATSLLVNGGETGSLLHTPLETLFRIVGRYNAVMGLKRLHNRLQDPASNRVLVCMVMEAVVHTVLDQ